MYQELNYDSLTKKQKLSIEANKVLLNNFTFQSKCY